MKALFSLTLALTLSTAWTAVAAPLPSFKHLPNYGVYMKCEPFSWSAMSYLHSNGIPAVRIGYGWQRMGGARGFHAAILFQWEGKIYFMDNERSAPRRVFAKTDMGAVNHILSDFYTTCWMVNDDNERIAPRKLVDLFAPAPAWLRELQVGPKR